VSRSSSANQPSSSPNGTCVFVKWYGKTVLVDWDSIRCLDYDCDPRRFCTPTTSCCADYEVTVGPRERKIIDGMLPLAARYVQSLRNGDGYDNLFEPVGSNLYAIEQDDEGVCRLGYRANGTLFCSLHSAALDVGIKPARVKPRACTLWPLALGPENGHLHLSIDPSAPSFPCVRLISRPRSGPTEPVADIIRSLFGKRVLNDLLAVT